jgi:hypothetical protein
MLRNLEDVQPADTIAQLCQLPFLSQALYAAAKLGVADLLAGRAKTSEELAQETHAHAPSLYRVLRRCAGWVYSKKSNRVVSRIEPGARASKRTRPTRTARTSSGTAIPQRGNQRGICSTRCRRDTPPGSGRLGWMYSSTFTQNQTWPLCSTPE